MCAELGLTAVVWDCGWDKDHRLALLSNFKNLVTHHKKEVVPVVKGRYESSSSVLCTYVRVCSTYSKSFYGCTLQ